MQSKKAKKPAFRKKRNYRKRPAKKKVTDKLNAGAVGTGLRSTDFFSIVPPHHSMKLIYCGTFQLSTGTAGVIGAVQQFRLNSLFDFDQSGGGHQPYGYDQWCAFYNQYRVNGAKVELLWNTIGGSSDVCCCSQVSTAVSLLTMAGNTIDWAGERNNVSTAVLSPSGNSRSIKQSIYLDMPTVFGVSKQKYRDDNNYCNVTGSNPGEQALLQLAVGSYSGSAGETVSVQVRCTFYATMFDRVSAPQS